MTENFVFYTGWLETIDGMAKELGEDYANKALYALVKYAVTGEMVTTSAFVKSWIIGSVMPNIDNARNRYDKAIADGSKGGAPQRVDRQQVINLYEAGNTQQQIAKELSCSERTIRNILRDCKTPETTGNNHRKEPETTPETTGNNLNKDIYKENEKDKETDTYNKNDTYNKIDKYNDNDTPFPPIKGEKGVEIEKEKENNNKSKIENDKYNKTENKTENNKENDTTSGRLYTGNLIENLLRLWNMDVSLAASKKKVIQRTIDSLKWYHHKNTLDETLMVLIEMKINNRYDSLIDWIGDRNDFLDWATDIIYWLRDRDGFADKEFKDHYQELVERELGKLGFPDDDKKSSSEEPDDDDDLPF